MNIEKMKEQVSAYKRICDIVKDLENQLKDNSLLEDKKDELLVKLIIHEKEKKEYEEKGILLDLKKIEVFNKYQTCIKEIEAIKEISKFEIESDIYYIDDQRIAKILVDEYNKLLKNEKYLSQQIDQLLVTDKDYILKDSLKIEENEPNELNDLNIETSLNLNDELLNETDEIDKRILNLIESSKLPGMGKKVLKEFDGKKHKIAIKLLSEFNSLIYQKRNKENKVNEDKNDEQVIEVISQPIEKVKEKKVDKKRKIFGSIAAALTAVAVFASSFVFGSGFKKGNKKDVLSQKDVKASYTNLVEDKQEKTNKVIVDSDEKDQQILLDQPVNVLENSYIYNTSLDSSKGNNPITPYFDNEIERTIVGVVFNINGTLKTVYKKDFDFINKVEELKEQGASVASYITAISNNDTDYEGYYQANDIKQVTKVKK